MQQYAISSQTGYGHLTDLPCINLQYGAASAIISLYGAQVLSYQPTPGKELLWLSPLASWQYQTPIRGGVPVCWPWFGPAAECFNPSKTTLSNHGLVRTRMWQVVSQQQTENGVSVTLQITLDELPHVADGASLQLEVCLADTLSITLRCDCAILQQAALHSYFAVADITQTKVWPLPERYHDKVSGQFKQAMSDSTGVSAEVDRIYATPASLLHLTDTVTHLDVMQHGQDATIVWNPWQQRCQQIGDLPDNAYSRFICVETARLQLNTVAPLQLTQQLKLA
jgi:glucose-6-phosphate 1-epimerase